MDKTLGQWDTREPFGVGDGSGLVQEDPVTQKGKALPGLGEWHYGIGQGPRIEEAWPVLETRGIGGQIMPELKK